LSDDIAPEQLEIQTSNSQEIGMCCKNYGGLLIGVGTAEVLGDYGAGPTHTLPPVGPTVYQVVDQSFTFYGFGPG